MCINAHIDEAVVLLLEDGNGAQRPVDVIEKADFVSFDESDACVVFSRLDERGQRADCRTCFKIEHNSHAVEIFRRWSTERGR